MSALQLYGAIWLGLLGYWLLYHGAGMVSGQSAPGGGGDGVGMGGARPAPGARRQQQARAFLAQQPLIRGMG